MSMEITRLIFVLGSNLCVLAVAWALYAGTGYLLFRRALKVCPFLIRLNLYPLLGWAFLVTFAYYLRLLALPFSKSGPWCFVALLLLLIISAGRFRGQRLRSPLPRVLLLLAGLFALNLIPLFLRFAIPDMRDVGTWGYDQRNYVFTAAGLLDEGLLPGMPHTATPWGLLAPYWEYFKDSLSQLISVKPEDLDWHYRSLQEKFETLRSASRDFALFPRRAFSALDALMASILRIDPQQAYTLSVWIHHIWLFHIAIIFSRLLRFKALGLTVALLAIVYWPNSHLALAADNRDQANCLILVFVLFILGQLQHPRFWPIVTCLCAILVGYPELAIPALVAFYAQRYDSARGVRKWLTQLGKEAGTAFISLLPLLPPVLLGLMHQWGSKSANRGLVFPVQYATPLARFDYLPGWKLLWDDSAAIRYVSLFLDITLLLLAAYGLVILFRRRQFGSLIGYGAVLVCGYFFLSKREYYPAYKVLTIIWPFFLWVLFVSISRLLAPSVELGSRPRPFGYALAAVLIIGSLPAITSIAQIPFPGSYRLRGPNEFLVDELSGDIKAFFRPRMSDINRLKEVSRDVSNKKHQVLVIADIPVATPYDIGFAQLLFRNESVFFPQSIEAGLRVWRYAPYPGSRAASSHQPIDCILFLNSIRTFDFHKAQRHIFAGTFDPAAFRQMNFCADLPLQKREQILIFSFSDVAPVNKMTEGGREYFPIKGGELSLDLYHVNAPVGQVARFSFAVSSPDSIPPTGSRLEVSLNGKTIEANDSTTSSIWTRTVLLSSEAMHQQLVIKLKVEESGAPPPQWYFEVTNFEGSTLVGDHHISDN